jgi:hypothetical protein
LTNLEMEIEGSLVEGGGQEYNFFFRCVANSNRRKDVESLVNGSVSSEISEHILQFYTWLY